MSLANCFQLKHNCCRTDSWHYALFSGTFLAEIWGELAQYFDCLSSEVVFSTLELLLPTVVKEQAHKLHHIFLSQKQAACIALLWLAYYLLISQV